MGSCRLLHAPCRPSPLPPPPHYMAVRSCQGTCKILTAPRADAEISTTPKTTRDQPRIILAMCARVRVCVCVCPSNRRWFTKGSLLLPVGGLVCVCVCVCCIDVAAGGYVQCLASVVISWAIGWRERLPCVSGQAGWTCVWVR